MKATIPQDDLNMNNALCEKENPFKFAKPEYDIRQDEK